MKTITDEIHDEMQGEIESLTASVDKWQGECEEQRRHRSLAESERDELRQALRDLLATRKGIDYTTAEEQDVLRRARRLAR